MVRDQENTESVSVLDEIELQHWEKSFDLAIIIVNGIKLSLPDER